LQKQLTIKKLLAGWLLLVFTLGVTPKLFLHKLAANHKDGIGRLSQQKDRVTIQKAFFSCDCNDIVAESPFLDDHSAVFVPAPPVYRQEATLLIPLLHATGLFFFELRGPPARA
jgi:hypothetical protein